MAWDDLDDLVYTGPIKVLRLKCDKIRFGSGSAVFRPAGLDVIRAALQQAKANPGQKVLIASHTDRQGSDAANQTLSNDRSTSTLLVLTHDQEEWAKFVVDRR